MGFFFLHINQVPPTPTEQTQPLLALIITAGVFGKGYYNKGVPARILGFSFIRTLCVRGNESQPEKSPC